ncbi:MAG: hypothetical protein QOJ15_1563, partial [Bradyrhizobium sp.]|nr:hypothetical protein [Bradyrhizobium sp.]
WKFPPLDVLKAQSLREQQIWRHKSRGPVWLTSAREMIWRDDVVRSSDEITFFVTLRSIERIAPLRNQSLVLCCG